MDRHLQILIVFIVIILISILFGSTILFVLNTLESNFQKSNSNDNLTKYELVDWMEYGRMRLYEIPSDTNCEYDFDMKENYTMFTKYCASKESHEFCVGSSYAILECQDFLGIQYYDECWKDIYFAYSACMESIYPYWTNYCFSTYVTNRDQYCHNESYQLYYPSEEQDILTNCSCKEKGINGQCELIYLCFNNTWPINEINFSDIYKNISSIK